jgi:hypothetical protein
MSDEELTPAERRLRSRPVVEPERTAVVWVVAIALVLVAALGIVVGALIFQDLTSHGEEGASVALAATAVVLAAIQLASGVGVFVGAGWARPAALILCVVNLIAGLLSMLDGTSPPATLLGLVVNFALLLALSGEKVRAWCG